MFSVQKCLRLLDAILMFVLSNTNYTGNEFVPNICFYNICFYNFKPQRLECWEEKTTTPNRANPFRTIRFTSTEICVHTDMMAPWSLLKELNFFGGGIDAVNTYQWICKVYSPP